MKHAHVFCLITLTALVFSCEHDKPFDVIVGKPVIVNIPKSNKNIDPSLKFNFNSLELLQNIQSVNLDQFKKYGSFYTRDFTIYQVNDLDLLEDNQYISEIYLFFIDETLHKIQALTTKNMSDFFLSKYGGAKLVLIDRFNKELVRNEGAIRNKSGKIHINKNLSNYKLKWRSPGVLISYKVDETAQKNFEVLEELIDIENQQNIRTRPSYLFTIQSDMYIKLLERVKYDELLSTKKQKRANNY